MTSSIFILNDWQTAISLTAYHTTKQCAARG
jgi:hypothetical protein